MPWIDIYIIGFLAKLRTIFRRNSTKPLIATIIIVIELLSQDACSLYCMMKEQRESGSAEVYLVPTCTYFGIPVCYC